MVQLLEGNITPGMTVHAPPDEFMAADWFLPILRRVEDFGVAFAREFDAIGINDWYRPFREQKVLYEGKRSTAAVSEHCFAAALDLDIPDEFRAAHALDFFAKVMKLDRDVRIGWLDYQKPNKQFTFFHAGFGFMVPFDVREKFINTYFAGAQAKHIWFKVNQSWKQGMKW